MSASGPLRRQPTIFHREPSTGAETTLGRIRETLALWKYRYEINTSQYMLDPWERVLFNVILLAVAMWFLYGAYNRAVLPMFSKLTASHI